MSRLDSIVLAGVAVERVASRYSLGGACLRVLAGISLLSQSGGRPTYYSVAALLGLADNSLVREAVRVLALGSYVSKHTGHGAKTGLRVEPAGERLVAILEREERALRAGVATIEVGRWKRPYVRSGKYVGRWAREQAARAGRAAQ